MFLHLSSEAKKPVNLYLCSLKSKSVRSENQGYILLMASELNLEQALTKIPVVQEYPDIFPEDIPELLPKREVEFSIDLVPGTRPISIAPYQMSSLDL